MTRTITVLYGRSGDKRDIEADVRGPFAIHPSIAIEGWTLTHSPTGRALLCATSRAACVKARDELLAAKGNWKSTDPHIIARRHRDIGRRVREKYGHGR